MTLRSNSLSHRTKTLLAVSVIIGFAAVLWRLLPPDEPVPPEVRETPAAAESETRTEPSADHSTGARAASARTLVDASALAERLAKSKEVAVLDQLLTASFIESLGTVTSPSVDYRERSAAVRSLGENLNAHEIDALYSFLLEPAPDDAEARRYDRAVKNDVFNLLRNQDVPPDGLTEVLAAVFSDRTQDGAVRDYALQHLGAWHSRAGEEDRSLVLETLEAALHETGGSLAGTALISLRHLGGAENPPDLTHLDLAGTASRILRDESASDLSRVSAMQISANEASPEILGPAAEWALDPSAGYVRRVSSIAALGVEGSEEAVRILAEVEALGDPHLEPALVSAYRKLEEAGVRPANANQP